MTKRERERVQIGTDAAGKPVYTWVEGKNRQDFLIKAAQTLLAYGMLDGCKPEQQEKAPQTPTFRQYAEQWWELYKLPKLRHTTRTTYRNLLDNHILPYFGKLRLEEIGTNTIQAFYNANREKAKSTTRQSPSCCIRSLIWRWRTDTCERIPPRASACRCRAARKSGRRCRCGRCRTFCKASTGFCRRSG